MAVRLNVATLTLIADALVSSASRFVTLFTNKAAAQRSPSRPARKLVKSYAGK